MITAQALLFDMDGTLVDSGPAIEASWAQWVEEYRIDRDRFTRIAGHGIPARQIAARLLPADRVAEATRRLEQLEIDRAPELRVLPGTRELLASLPDDAWAIVTSCTRPLAIARVKAVGIDPPLMITADDVTAGKPDPEPYLLAARRLDADPARCVVFEDAPAGLASARAAGARTVAVTTTTPADELRPCADTVVADLGRVDCAPAVHPPVEIEIHP
ncbi:HAD-IA family hydrolase [Streptomonospora wellingtoniae]|uniref:HAD-IA family hydrolase n=1 Tax=Streptomonospora wellingtoniae TaxID=3075544 RepID=A0ABU2KX48_9ACTN|nr:HAD-IA family hydrolase [Streptomonospora sp. DSM 45055]MDT0303742.1 HAD-IA family hydrolase [Streptomonospora sp. DSM 45055]